MNASTILETLGNTSMPSGLWMGSSKIGPGENAVKSAPTKTAAKVNRADHLQRAPGSLPLGK